MAAFAEKSAFTPQLFAVFVWVSPFGLLVRSSRQSMIEFANGVMVITGGWLVDLFGLLEVRYRPDLK